MSARVRALTLEEALAIHEASLERFGALTLEEALAIHEASLERFGGLPGLRDEGLLESAV